MVQINGAQNFRIFGAKLADKKKELQNLEMHSLHRNAYLACKEAIIVEGTTTSNQTVRM